MSMRGYLVFGFSDKFYHKRECNMEENEKLCSTVMKKYKVPQ